ncbi:hypothetical protein LCGC14_0388630 [marine sediment metagenome]|uniref:Methyltransferase domain-containing protein n=1 Tax=marine sediment metagenome TaxID=412755 RepID=A0A0F9VME1_9ZZZZ
MDLDLYDDDFFKWHYKYVHWMSVGVGKAFAKQYKFKSIVDYGCGIGSYLLGCQEEGVRVKGYEISPAAHIHTNSNLHPYIEYMDFLTIAPEKYEVCMCIEVAEHIDSHNSKQLVKILTMTSDFIVFSAAPPGQEGTGHINCQPFEYWIDLFKKRHFKQYRPGKVLESWIDAPDYVIKNLMVFTK